MRHALGQIRDLMDLRKDTDYAGTDEAIRQNSHFKSANAWTLIFAIFIASVGLNVNSTAVIIGAMLISPLMGPILGAGYALGVRDFSLLQESVRNLVYAVLISLGASTLYFLLSPFSEAQSELMARTAPNFYDLLIAVFGGAAGIVAMSRGGGRSNAVPGVAIATALMPPLCTAGYGIATLQWKFLVGALYLFVINSVFICLSTYVFVRSLKFSKVSYANPREQERIDRWIFGTAAAVAVPSLVTAWLLLAQSNFRAKAGKFVEKEARHKGSFLIDKQFVFDPRRSVIKLTFIGAKMPPTTIEALERRKDAYGLEKSKLEVVQMAIEDHVDAQLSRAAAKDLPMRQQLAGMEVELKSLREERRAATAALAEARAFAPEIMALNLQGGEAGVVWKKRPAAGVRRAVEEFLRVRQENPQLRVVHSISL